MVATVRHLRSVEPVPKPPSDELEILFREHYDQIYRAAYRVTGNAMDAEDVLQTVFLRLARRDASGLDLQPNATAYLIRSSINAALDIMRSRTRSRLVQVEEAEDIKHSIASPEQQHEDSEIRKLVQQAVAKLGSKAAEMFVLRYFEGYGNREISQMLGTSQMVVGVILHRSRAKLRKEIGEYLEKHNA